MSREASSSFRLPQCGRSGFTVIELIVVVAIFVITVSVAFPFLGKFQRSETLETLGQDVVQVLRRAQHRAITGERDRAWGVSFQAGSYILFAGTSYATRDMAFDEQHTVVGAFTFSGASEITFEKFSGRASTAGTVTIAHSGGETRSVNVNSAGAIFLQ